MDDLTQNRRRLDARSLPLGGRPSDFDQPPRHLPYVGKVFNGGAMPGVVPAMFATNPVDIAATQEGEGLAPGLSTDTTRTIFVVVLGPKVPRAGDFVLAEQVGGLWVGEVGGTKPKETDPARGCAACTAKWPSRLYLATPYGSVTLDKDAPGTIVPGSWSGCSVKAIPDGSTIDAMGGIVHVDPVMHLPQLRIGTGVFGDPDMTAHGVAVSTPIHYEVGCQAAGPQQFPFNDENNIALTIRYPIGAFLVTHDPFVPTLFDFSINNYPNNGGCNDTNWNRTTYGTPAEIAGFGAIAIISPVRALAYNFFNFKNADLSMSASCGASSGIALDFHFLNYTPALGGFDSSTNVSVPALADYGNIPAGFEVGPINGGIGLTTCYGDVGLFNHHEVILRLTDTPGA